MSSSLQEIFHVRIVSCLFVILALAIFKPFGLDMWQWEAYIHLLNIFVMGVVVCMFSDLVMKYIVGMPSSHDQGVDYIIRRNLWFQFINTPLVAFMICLYRHFILSNKIEGNQLSVSNFLETLLIIAFCSFAIGLYWRFKYRSRYLAAELEETRLLNEQLQKIQQTALLPTSVPYDAVTKEQKEAAISLPQNAVIKYVEAVGNYVKVFHLCEGKVRTDMLRATSKQIEDDLHNYPMIIRCHRAFIVNLQQVQQIISKSGSMQLLINHCLDYLPVSRSNMAQIKDSIKKL